MDEYMRYYSKQPMLLEEKDYYTITEKVEMATQTDFDEDPLDDDSRLNVFYCSVYYSQEVSTYCNIPSPRLIDSNINISVSQSGHNKVNEEEDMITMGINAALSENEVMDLSYSDDDYKEEKDEMNDDYSNPEESESEEKPYSCNSCGTKFRSRSQIKLPYECDKCPKAFPYLASLRYHKKTRHTNQRLYLCDICHKSFKSDHNVYYHKKTVHFPDKKHKCSVCEKCFTDKTKLTNHMRTHTGVKPYGCGACGAKFTQNGNLKIHIRSVHGVYVESVKDDGTPEVKLVKYKRPTRKATPGAPMPGTIYPHNNVPQPSIAYMYTNPVNVGNLPAGMSGHEVVVVNNEAIPTMITTSHAVTETYRTTDTTLLN